MSKSNLLPMNTSLDRFSQTVTSRNPDAGLIAIYNEMYKAEKTRSHNYVLDDIMKKRALCYTTTYIEENYPALASVAWLRPMYNGIIRLVTRYCVNPSLTHVNFGKGTRGMRLDTVDHIIQQMEFCSNLGYTDFFIGREDKTPNGKFSKKMAANITKLTGTNWKCSDKPILVAPNFNAIDCWQYVIYNNRINFNNDDKAIFV